MTPIELDALAVRVSAGYDYLSSLEYEGPEYNKWWSEYEGLCEQLRAGLGLPDYGRME